MFQSVISPIRSGFEFAGLSLNLAANRLPFGRIALS